MPDHQWIIGTPFFEQYLITFDLESSKVQFDGKIVQVTDPFRQMTPFEILLVILIVLVVVTTFIVVSIICIKRDKERKAKLMERYQVMIQNKKKRKSKIKTEKEKRAE